MSIGVIILNIWNVVIFLINSILDHFWLRLSLCSVHFQNGTFPIFDNLRKLLNELLDTQSDSFHLLLIFDIFRLELFLLVSNSLLGAFHHLTKIMVKLLSARLDEIMVVALF